MLDRSMEARLVQTDAGLLPEGEGWYVLNAREAAWLHHDAFGAACTFEGDLRFPELGINIGVVHPGQPASLYHAEDAQEDFLVLAGECLLLVEGEERPLRQWDFFHCPAGTEHVLVGAGSGPSLVLAAGARGEGKSIVYPVSEPAGRHGASAERETTDPGEAYERFGRPERGPAPELP
jgi:uncharacterized cupin superfamily protein